MTFFLLKEFLGDSPKEFFEGHFGCRLSIKYAFY